MTDTDEILYYRYLAEHDEDAFRILLDRHRESLMLFLYSFVHSMEDAEELMLDAYAEAAAGANFSKKSSFKTWLFSIGKNLALMHLRRQRFVFRHDKQSDIPDPASDPPELDILKEEQNQQLYQALSQLKPEYRQILILLYFEKMSFEEAERIMGKSRKQIYNLAERGRAALREKLERMGFEHAQYG